MKRCPECKELIKSDATVCPKCGHTEVSAEEASLDRMVQAASLPNLADLFRKGQDAGLITPAQEYVST